MSYPETVRYLYALGNELKVGAKFGLDRMRALADALGNPHRRFQVVHVAGTNGKGSTSAMIAAALGRSGLRTGLYTSPHLVKPTERIRINGQPVSDEQFDAFFRKVHRAAEQLMEQDRIDAHPSYFETVTLMAFEAFAEAADVAVVEVGLGGRLDATNLVEPSVTAITPIGYDHEAFLGNTLTSIAGEKAGIIKPGIPVVMAPQPEEAAAVITARAAEFESPLVRVDQRSVDELKVEAYGSSFRFGGCRFECPLAGEHQVVNALTAIETCRQLGLPLETIRTGIAQTKWPGRLQRVRKSPDFILDGAHNPAGAAALARYIQQFFANRRVWLVYGAMRDKAIDEIVGELFPLAEKVILTAPQMPRALRPEAIAEAYEHPNYAIALTIDEAIRQASEAPADAAVFFTGSLFIVGEAAALLCSHRSAPQ